MHMSKYAVQHDCIVHIKIMEVHNVDVGEGRQV